MKTVTSLRAQIDLEPVTEDEMNRFTSKLCIDGVSQCWVWVGAKSSGKRTRLNSTYGSFWFRGRMVRAHLFAFAALTRHPVNETVDHVCERTLCVNPLHLEPATNTDNCKRGYQKVLRKRLTTSESCGKMQTVDGDDQ